MNALWNECRQCSFRLRRRPGFLIIAPSLSDSPNSSSIIMVRKCQALLHPRKSRPEKHLAVGRRDRAFAVPNATGRRRLTTFGCVTVATPGILSILAASARRVCISGQLQPASCASNGQPILNGIRRSSRGRAMLAVDEGTHTSRAEATTGSEHRSG